MDKIRIDKDTLTPDEIVKYITKYEETTARELEEYWEYYEGENCKILNKKQPDANNPDNRTPVPYGRKIITTFVGYAYRPGFITYKSENEAYLKELQKTFDENNEKIKTSTHGRNTGVYGFSYELMYLGQDKYGNAEVKFTVIDPTEMIVFYNFDLEPRKLLAVRFYPVSGEEEQRETGKRRFKLVVYYPNEVIYYDWIRDYGKGTIVEERREPNYFKEVPVVIYEMQDCEGLIDPVIPLIDDYDALVSDSMNEFDRFSHAYLKLVGMGLGDSVKSASPGNGNIVQNALRMLKRRRVFEQLKNKDDVTFLTKDIPTDYIKFMTELIAKQIHEQSHVPDFTSFKDLTGVAVQRLMFDFENVVSSAEAEFDTGLMDRIRLITNIYKTTGRAAGEPSDITISHKRNTPLNVKEYADTALVMKNTGFSMYAITDYMPDEVIPDTDAELARQREETDKAMADVEAMANQQTEPDQDEDNDGGR